MKKLITLSLTLAIYMAGFSQLTISEIMYNPPESGVDSTEYVEITNTSMSSVNIGGYKLYIGVRSSPNSTFTFPSMMLLPGSSVVVCNDSLAVQSYFGSTFYGGIGALSNSGREVIVTNAANAVIDSVRYSSSSPWPSSANGNGSSLVFCDPTKDNADGANWMASTHTVTGKIINGKQLYGSPGAIDSACTTTPPPPAPIPHYTISSIIGIDANGVSDSLGVKCSVSGVVHGLDMSGLSSSSNTFQLYDASGVIQVYKSGGFSPAYTVLQSDSVTLWGTVGQYAGMMQFEPDSIKLHSTGATTMAYTRVSKIDETTENKYIRLDSVVLINSSQWPSPNNNANVAIKTLLGDTVTLRIDRDGHVDDSVTAPAGMFDVIGYGGQFDNTSPHNSGYQIQPQLKSDINVHPVATCNTPSALSSSKITDVSAELSWTSGGSNTWNIEYGTKGFTQGSGTKITVTMNPYMLTGLTLSTDYDFYVQDSCAGLGVSGWAGASSFKTLAAPKPIPIYPIQALRTVNASGVLDSNFVRCGIEGIVVNDNFSASGVSGPDVSFVVVDLMNRTGLTAVSFVDTAAINYAPHLGDSVRVYGKVSQYNGLAQFEIDSVIILKRMVRVPMPFVTDTLGELTESRFIELRGVRLVDPSQWPSAGTDRTLKIVNMKGDTLDMRIDQHTNVAANWPVAPAGPFTLKGVGGQFDNSSPYLGGYQVFPRYFTDIDTAAPPAPCTPSADLATSDITKNSVKVAWTAGGGTSWNVGWAKHHTATKPTDSTMGVTTNPHMISGLDSNQHYHIWIQDVCPAGPPSAWVGPVMFTTLPGANAIEEAFANRISLKAYPNPNNTGMVKLNKTVDFVVVNIVGQPVLEKTQSNSFSVSNLESGMYIIQSKDGDTVRLIVE